MKLSTFFSVFIIAFLLFACSKKDNKVSKTTLLTTGSWNITSSLNDDDGDGIYETDNLAMSPACFKDNYFTFFTNGQFEINEGPTKCDPMDPQTESVSWQFANNETKLIVDADTYDLVELSNTTLIIKENLSGGRRTKATFSKR